MVAGPLLKLSKPVSLRSCQRVRHSKVNVKPGTRLHVFFLSSTTFFLHQVLDLLLSTVMCISVVFLVTD